MNLRKLHHIGFVVSDIRKAVENFKWLLNPSFTSEIFRDERQKVYVCFIPIDTTNDIFIELIQPLDEKSPVYNFLLKGGGFHHICYAVDDMEAVIKDLRSKGALLITEPKEATAFTKRRIAFLCYKENFLFELVEDEMEWQ